MAGAILALNSGSSSLKFGVYEVEGASLRQLLSGEAEWQDSAGSFRAMDAAGTELENTAVGTQQEAVTRIGKLLDGRQNNLRAVGHRVVHGGPQLRRHCVIDGSVMTLLTAAAEFAPLHVPAALSLIRYATGNFRGIPQVACFDTAFHAGLPDVARIFALPHEMSRQGVERFGFHGLSCESIIRQLQKVPERLIIAHLGNGASITAVRNGRSVDTSMGLTPTGGVIMGTRCGDLDPGVLILLMRRHGFDATTLEELVDHRSGLLGISGVSSDMRKLRQSAPAHPGAALAIEMFCYSVRKQIAAMAAALGGVDMLVFTGGIGEHDPIIRDSICQNLAFLSIGKTLVLPSQEDEQIALHSWQLTADPA